MIILFYVVFPWANLTIVHWARSYSLSPFTEVEENKMRGKKKVILLLWPWVVSNYQGHTSKQSKTKQLNDPSFFISYLPYFTVLDIYICTVIPDNKKFKRFSTLKQRKNGTSFHSIKWVISVLGISKDPKEIIKWKWDAEVGGQLKNATNILTTYYVVPKVLIFYHSNPAN